MHITSHRATHGGFEPRVRMENYSYKQGVERAYFRWCSVRSDKMKEFPPVDTRERPFEVSWLDMNQYNSDFVIELYPNKHEKNRPLRVSVVGTIHGFVRYGGQSAPQSLIKAVKEGGGKFGLHTFVIPAGQSIKINGIGDL